MIINGDWSWADYVKTPGIDAAVAVMPIVSATGQPMRTMFSPKGYSLNANTSPEMAEHAMAFVRHMVSDEVQRRIVEKLRMLPARQSIQKDPLFASDPTLQASLAQLKNGRLMPTGTELRAIWDGMKPNYQGLLSGAMSPAAAAAAMQRDSVRNIEVMNREYVPSRSAAVIQVLGGLLLGGLDYLAAAEFRAVRARLASQPDRLLVRVAGGDRASLRWSFFRSSTTSSCHFPTCRWANFHDWQIVGLQNYIELFTDPELRKFWYIFAKTIVWTVVNIAFHVGLGVLLAVALNGPIRGKAMYRILLIIPVGGAGVYHGTYLARDVRLRIRGRQSDAEPHRPVSAGGVAAGAVESHTAGQLARRCDTRFSGVHRHQRLARLSVHDGHRAWGHAGDSARAVRGGTDRSGVAVATVSPHHAAAVEARAAAGDHAGHHLDIQQSQRHLARFERRRAAGLDAHSGFRTAFKDADPLRKGVGAAGIGLSAESLIYPTLEVQLLSLTWWLILIVCIEASEKPLWDRLLAARSRRAAASEPAAARD